MWGNPFILFAQQRIFPSRGQRSDPDWRAGLVGGIACEGHRILAGISIFLLEESTEPFNFRKKINKIPPKFPVTPPPSSNGKVF